MGALQTVIDGDQGNDVDEWLHETDESLDWKGSGKVVAAYVLAQAWGSALPHLSITLVSAFTSQPCASVCSCFLSPTFRLRSLPPLL